MPGSGPTGWSVDSASLDVDGLKAFLAEGEGADKDAFMEGPNIAERVPLEHYASHGWNSSTTKVVDNAVVGYCKHHRLNQASFHRALVARAKEMGIYDQIVAEAKTRAPSDPAQEA